MPLRVLEPQPAHTPDWEALYREHVQPVYRYVYARAGNRPDAEDVTSAVFLQALPRLRMTPSTAETRAYLYATARTALADLWRQRHGAQPAELDDSVANDVRRPEADIDVEPLLAPLPPHYRQVLELRFLRGYTIKETAQAMGISVANAKVMQLRALRRAAQQGDAP